MTKVSYSKKNSVFLYPLDIKDKTKMSLFRIFEILMLLERILFRDLILKLLLLKTQIIFTLKIT